jgi:hypothetical protein
MSAGLLQRRPRLALYGDEPAKMDLRCDNTLNLFKNAVAAKPNEDALVYSTGTSLTANWMVLAIASRYGWRTRASAQATGSLSSSKSHLNF